MLKFDQYLGTLKILVLYFSEGGGQKKEGFESPLFFPHVICIFSQNAEARNPSSGGKITQQLRNKELIRQEQIISGENNLYL